MNNIHTIGSAVSSKFSTTRENILDFDKVQEQRITHAISCGSLLGKLELPNKILYVLS